MKSDLENRGLNFWALIEFHSARSMLATRRSFLRAAAASGAAMALSPWVHAQGAGAKSPQRYRACVIGHTGRGNYGHGLDTCFARIDRVEVVALADPDERGRAEAQKRCAAARSYADWRVMLDREKPTLVAVGPRWVEHRVEMLRAAAGLGAHVYMEKPLALSLVDADAIVEAARSAKTHIALAFHSLNAPSVLHLKRQIEAGLLGDLLEIRTRGKEDHRAGGEDFAVLGTHCLYTLRLFLGAPLWCSARVSVGGREISRADAREATEPLGPIAGDSLHASYAFAGGVQGSFSSQKVSKGPGGRFQALLLGSKGQAVIHFGMDPQVFFLADPLWSPGSTGAKWEKVPGDPGNACQNGLSGQEACNFRLVSDLLDAVETGRSPVAGVEEGRAVLEMNHAAYASQLRGGRVALPLQDRRHPLAG